MILVYSANYAEHEKHLKIELEKLREKKLFAKFKKCEFWLEEVAFLGHVVNRDGLAVDPAKVRAVVEKERPTSVREIRSFLGLAGYYMRFYWEIFFFVTALRRKNAPFVWRDECEASFQELKCRLITAPVLTLPMELVGLYGCIKEYASRQSKEQEKNYPTHDLELAAVVYVLKIWRHYSMVRSVKFIQIIRVSSTFSHRGTWTWGKGDDLRYWKAMIARCFIILLKLM